MAAGRFLGRGYVFRVVGIFDYDHYQSRDSRRQLFVSRVLQTPRQRILPVFACVLLCTTVVAAIFFLSFDLRQYVKSAVYALLFAANLFLRAVAVILMRMRRKAVAAHLVAVVGRTVLLIFPALLILFSVSANGAMCGRLSFC